MILFCLTKCLRENQLTGGELVRFITAAARASQREGCVDGLNLTLTQFKVTYLLDSADGELPTSELVPQPGLRPGMTSRVDALVRRESVDRPESDGDRRLKSLRLTRAGLDHGDRRR
jgi:DNA-binding MarR family transcriptional regulator